MKVQELEKSPVSAGDESDRSFLPPRDVISVGIGDPTPTTRQELRQLVSRENDLRLIGEAADGRTALQLLRNRQPEIFLLELKLPQLDGFAVLEMLKGRKLRTRVIVVTSSDDEADYVRAMRLGAWGILRKRAAAELLAKSIRRVHSGEIWLDQPTMVAVIRGFAAQGEGGSRTAGSSLTPREGEIVSLVALRLTNKQIAERMFISAQTVKNHLHNIFEKLGFTDRLQLALYAIQQEMQGSQADGSRGWKAAQDAAVQMAYTGSVPAETERTPPASRVAAVA